MECRDFFTIATTSVSTAAMNAWAFNLFTKANCSSTIWSKLSRSRQNRLPSRSPEFLAGNVPPDFAADEVDLREHGTEANLTPLGQSRVSCLRSPQPSETEFISSERTA